VRAAQEAAAAAAAAAVTGSVSNRLIAS